MQSYLPASILKYVRKRSEDSEGERSAFKPPIRQTYSTAVLFADVSGYTALCERCALRGTEGDEYLASKLNSYFELLVRVLQSHGGDVFKFAGDAVIVLWPPTAEDLQTITRRVGQCALDISAALQGAKIDKDVEMSVKLGVGVGELSILHVGGVYDRIEYLAAGEPLAQAFRAEHRATRTEVVMSPEAWAMVRDFFDADEQVDGHVFLKAVREQLRKISLRAHMPKKLSGGWVSETLSRYVPAAVVPYVSKGKELWACSNRQITTLFINLGMSESDLVDQNSTMFIQNVVVAVQKAAYHYQGSINKFLLDDKGSTIVAVFGLRPLAHQDDAARGCLAALKICHKLRDLGLNVSIGITTGMAFCGIIGPRARREYSVLGDNVNLAARLMQHASTLAGGSIVCDETTRENGIRFVKFVGMGQIKVKGKTGLLRVYRPFAKRDPDHYIRAYAIGRVVVRHSILWLPPFASRVCETVKSRVSMGSRFTDFLRKRITRSFASTVTSESTNESQQNMDDELDIPVGIEGTPMGNKCSPLMSSSHFLGFNSPQQSVRMILKKSASPKSIDAADDRRRPFKHHQSASTMSSVDSFYRNKLDDWNKADKDLFASVSPEANLRKLRLLDSPSSRAQKGLNDGLHQHQLKEVLHASTKSLRKTLSSRLPSGSPLSGLRSLVRNLKGGSVSPRNRDSKQWGDEYSMSATLKQTKNSRNLHKVPKRLITVKLLKTGGRLSFHPDLNSSERSLFDILKLALNQMGVAPDDSGNDAYPRLKHYLTAKLDGTEIALDQNMDILTLFELSTACGARRQTVHLTLRQNENQLHAVEMMLLGKYMEVAKLKKCVTCLVEGTPILFSSRASKTFTA